MYILRIFKSRAIEYLIAINGFMFFLTLFVQPLFYLLALTPAKIFVMPWTIITSMFLHGGFSHILFNMIALFFFGTYLERLTSTDDFLRVYFIGGFFAGIAYIITAPLLGTVNTPAVGASGAIFAVMGALVVLRPHMTIYLNFFFPMPLWLFATLYTVMAIGTIGTGMTGGVAENAHMGGLVVGLAMGYYLKKREKPITYEYQGYRYY